MAAHGLDLSTFVQLNCFEHQEETLESTKKCAVSSLKHVCLVLVSSYPGHIFPATTRSNFSRFLPLEK